MRLLLGTIIALTAINSCAGKKAESRQAEQPTEVSGGFGLTMQCSVINRKDTDASSSSVGCLVFNDDGSPYAGSITETSAEAVSSTGQVIKTSQIVSGEDAEGFSVLVQVSGLKPWEAATIRVTGVFDGKLLILVASLKEFATTCTQDIKLYVDANAPSAARLCSSTNKCRTITQALSLLPDIINCKVTIDVAKGLYTESIRIDDKVIRRAGLLLIQGVGRTAEGNFDTILTNDDTHPNDLIRARHFVVTGIGNGGGANIPVLEIKNLALHRNTSPRAFDGDTFGVISHSSNIKFENIEISGHTNAIYAPTTSSIDLDTVDIIDAASGLFARNASAIRIAGNINIKGVGKTNPKTLGIDISNPGLLTIGAINNPLKSLKLENFYHGIRLSGAVANFRGGEKVNLLDVHHGISLYESSALVLPSLKEAAPVEISIKNFTGSGILVSNSSIRDGESAIWKPYSETLLHSLSLEGAPDSAMIWATNTSTIDLTRTNFNFCFKSYLESLSTPWNAATPSIYAIAVDSDSEARFSWATSPFKFGETCSSPVTPQKLYIKRYKYRFPATMSGEAKICPAGYFLQSDDHCYGSLGQARFTPPAGTASDHNFFGVLESDSRIDHLPSTNP